MYTFGILAAFFFLLSGAIFGKRIKQNQHMVALIVVAGTLIGSVIVNGILGLSIPFSEVEVRTKALLKGGTEIFTPTDTMKFYSYVEFNYKLKEGKKETEYNNIEICLLDDIYPSEKDKLEIRYIPEGDTIAPYVSIRKFKRVVDNKWVTPFGLPNGGRRYVAFIPNDSIHNVLMDQINDKFYMKDEEQIAQSN